MDARPPCDDRVPDKRRLAATDWAPRISPTVVQKTLQQAENWNELSAPAHHDTPECMRSTLPGEEVPLPDGM